MTDPIWIVMPVLAGQEMTRAAISDCLAQSVPTKLLIINQGIPDEFRDELERIAEQDHRVFLWNHQPPLPSLSASWNLALDTVWQAGGEVALVVNNDVRLAADTVRILSKARSYDNALFVSAVGVTAEQFAEAARPLDTEALPPAFFVGGGPHLAKGGPDFSCFLISRECHQQYRFDEHFIPCFAEDLDYHRRLMLAGDGSRIFSVNLPYLHLASQTLRHLEREQPKEADRIKRQIDAQSRAYYAKKWGGPVNAETFFSPFDQGVEGISTAGMPNPPTTPALQRWAAEPPIAELSRRTLALTEIKRPQEEIDGEDTRPVEALGSADPDTEIF
jgi:hypothetical protein